MKVCRNQVSKLNEVLSYYNVGLTIMDNETSSDFVTIEIISKERFTMLKGSFNEEVYEVLHYSPDLTLPKFSVVRNKLGKIKAVRMLTYFERTGRQIEVFYDEYNVC